MGAMIKDVIETFMKEHKVQACAYMQPPKPASGSSEEPPLGCIGIGPAFNTKETLAQCEQFLKEHAAKTNSQAICVVARKEEIAYPKVWNEKKKSAWKFGPNSDGIFLQLESPSVRQVYFTAFEKNAAGAVTGIGETVDLSVDDFALLPK